MRNLWIGNRLALICIFFDHDYRFARSKFFLLGHFSVLKSNFFGIFDQLVEVVVHVYHIVDAFFVEVMLKASFSFRFFIFQILRCLLHYQVFQLKVIFFKVIFKLVKNIHLLLFLDITNVIIGKKPFQLLFDHCFGRCLWILWIIWVFICFVFGLLDIDNLVENVLVNIIILKVIKAHDVFTLVFA